MAAFCDFFLKVALPKDISSIDWICFLLPPLTTKLFVICVAVQFLRSVGAAFNGRTRLLLAKGWRIGVESPQPPVLKGGGEDLEQKPQPQWTKGLSADSPKEKSPIIATDRMLIIGYF